MSRHFLAIMGYATISGLLVAPCVALAENNWEEKPFSYIAVNQEISSVLKEFSYINDIPVIASDKVRGHVQGRWLNLSSRDFLQKMSHLYDFDWYNDGAALYISSKSERITQIIPLHNHTLSELRSALLNMGLLDNRFDIGAGPANDTLAVSGPPRLVSMVQQTVLSLPSTQHAIKTSGGEVRHLTLFRGSAVSDVIVN
ncbi:hypothetical protein AD951_06885 [Acetobacter malorum]|uniref:Uncharacterized protein n=1 Tax=Acetobacter malorum TaxID=178901 RepID=A0A149UN59_9PROT|nr:secretin N-terminal domain-containing protein [Acetobacter malorum]KXV69387.1 hypothetical protein AD951_06885 [Acetobacter malorum]